VKARTRLGLDAVDNGFRLDQVDAPIEEGPFRKLACFSEVRALFQHELEYRIERPWATVAIYLDDVFAGITVRRAHHDQENFIDRIAVCADLTMKDLAFIRPDIAVA
jgi:hypothetical protein